MKWIFPLIMAGLVFGGNIRVISPSAGQTLITGRGSYKELCGGLKEGEYFIRIKAGDYEAKSEIFRIAKPRAEIMSLFPKKRFYTVGKKIELSWEAKKASGVLSLWRKNEKFCIISDKIGPMEGKFIWKVQRGCGNKSLMGKFVQFRLYSDGKEMAESPTFKVVGEMPGPRTRPFTKRK